MRVMSNVLLLAWPSQRKNIGGTYVSHERSCATHPSQARMYLFYCSNVDIPPDQLKRLECS
jgi:hypothetical protein